MKYLANIEYLGVN